MEILSRAENMFGPISADYREKIRAYLLEPSVEGWDEIHCMIIRKRDLLTVWQSVLAVDPSFARIAIPQKLRARPKPHQKWLRYPDAATTKRALRKALARNKHQHIKENPA